ncbi:MAG TPA: hypothetical protein VF111_07770 [Thermoanaerobaculia bacterium]
MIARSLRLSLLLAVLAACSRGGEDRAAARPNVTVPPEIATLAADALRAASEIKVGGDIEAVLRAHQRSPRYAAAMAKHFALMRELHRAGLEARLRYPRSSVAVQHDQFCQRSGVAHLVVTAMVRYDMESIPPAAGAPPYTAGQEEHVFRFEQGPNGQWTMAAHHEIGLAEMHQKEVVARLRNPCARGAD